MDLHNLRQAFGNPAAQVDVTFSGHDHKYERTCPVYKKRCLDLDANSSATAPVHVVIGNAGYKLSWGYNPHTPPYWEAMALEHGYLRCEANKTSFRCEASSCCLFTQRCYAARFVDKSSPALPSLELSCVARMWRVSGTPSVQEVSSLDLRVLDSWALHKPPGWQPNLLARAIAQQLFISNYTNGSWIEDPGGLCVIRRAVLVRCASEYLGTLTVGKCARQAFRRKAIS